MPLLPLWMRPPGIIKSKFDIVSSLKMKICSFNGLELWRYRNNFTQNNEMSLLTLFVGNLMAEKIPSSTVVVSINHAPSK
jgi:hypothetical protein